MRGVSKGPSFRRSHKSCCLCHDHQRRQNISDLGVSERGRGSSWSLCSRTDYMTGGVQGKMQTRRALFNNEGLQVSNSRALKQAWDPSEPGVGLGEWGSVTPWAFFAGITELTSLPISALPPPCRLRSRLLSLA